MVIDGTINRFVTSSCGRTGRTGRIIDTGKDKQRGMFRAIELDHQPRERTEEAERAGILPEARSSAT
jgi:hypothetical protein